jgi:flagellar hook-associated protein 1
MSGLTQALNIGVSGLSAASEGMQTVSNNTANVNTPGYNIESINQVEMLGTNVPAGGLGLGTDVTSVQRGFSQFVYQQIVQATSTNQAAQTILSNAQNLASMFPVASGGANGLGAILSAFFGAANTVSQDPSSMPNREVFLSNAQSVTSLFHSVGAELASNLQTQNQQIGQTVSQVNSLAQQIASLNATIASQTGPTSSATNSLLDQRDQLVQQLAQQVGITTISGSAGSVDVYTAGGSALVNGNNSYSLTATSGSFLDGNVEVTYGPTGQDLTNSISGGVLGGLIGFRSQLTSAANSIGALATSFAATVNGQQTQGLDLNGNLGAALFTTAPPAVYAASGNTGAGSLSAVISNAAALVPDNFTVTKTAGGYQATDSVTGQTTVLGAGPTFSLNGITMTVSGTVNVGDSFEVEPVVNAAQGIQVATTDPTAIAAAAPYIATPGAITSGSIVDNNVGNVQATVGGPVAIGSLPGSAVVIPSTYFGQEMSIDFTSGTTFNVLSSGGGVIGSGNFTVGGGGEVAIDYPAAGPAGEAVSISLSPGTAVAGDSFVVSPGGPGNNGNMVAMAGLNSDKLIANQTLGNYYAQTVTNIGNQGQEAQIAGQAAQGVLSSATTIQQSISGVNLDEQAAQLVSYQQAYQASAQVISTAQTLLNDLIAAIQAA